MFHVHGERLAHNAAGLSRSSRRGGWDPQRQRSDPSLMSPPKSTMRRRSISRSVSRSPSPRSFSSPVAEQKVIQRLQDEQEEMKSRLAVLSREAQNNFQEADKIHNQTSIVLHQLRMQMETLRSEVRFAAESCHNLEQKISRMEQENAELEHLQQMSRLTTSTIVEHLPEEALVFEDDDSDTMSC